MAKPFPQRQRTRSRPLAPGFTLLETLMALVIIGVGVLAFVDAQTAFHRSNSWSSQAATSQLLANEIRELSRRLTRHDPVTGLSLNGGVLIGWGREPGEVTVDDIDDLDDLDGVTFGGGGTFLGPIDAFGEVIPQIDRTGNVVMDNGNPVPMIGWVQRVFVDKVDPYNFVTARSDSYEQPASSSLPLIAVDQFPVRVTVIVEYQSLSDSMPREITRTSWVIPPG